jgi:hypothetical protein
MINNTVQQIENAQRIDSLDRTLAQMEAKAFLLNNDIQYIKKKIAFLKIGASK